MEIAKVIHEKASRIAVIVVMAALLSISLAACGGDAATATATPPTPAPNTGAATDNTPAASTGGSGDMQQVDAKLSEWAVTLSTKELKAGKVQFNVTNDGQFTHDLAVLDNGNSLGATPKFKKGEGAKTLQVELKPGTYQVICDITGHPDKGMKTEITVK